MQDAFAKLPLAINDYKISSDAKVIFALIANRARWANASFPSHADLAKAIGKSTRMVRRYLDELQVAGLVQIKRNGLGKTNSYSVEMSTPDRTPMSTPDRTPMSTPDRTPMSTLEAPSYSNGFKEINTKEFIKETPDQLTQNSISDQEEKPLPDGRGSENAAGSPSADSQIDFYDQVRLTMAPSAPEWFATFAVSHARRWCLNRSLDAITIADWWPVFAKIKGLSANELEEASLWLLTAERQPKGRPEHPRMLSARVLSARQSAAARPPMPTQSRGHATQIAQKPPDPEDQQKAREIFQEFLRGGGK